MSAVLNKFYTLAGNSPFHVDQWNVEGLLMKRDVTAGVHFSAILGYFNITIYGDKGHNRSAAVP